MEEDPSQNLKESLAQFGFAIIINATSPPATTPILSAYNQLCINATSPGNTNWATFLNKCKESTLFNNYIVAGPVVHSQAAWLLRQDQYIQNAFRVAYNVTEETEMIPSYEGLTVVTGTVTSPQRFTPPAFTVDPTTAKYAAIYYPYETTQSGAHHIFHLLKNNKQYKAILPANSLVLFDATTTQISLVSPLCAYSSNHKLVAQHLSFLPLTSHFTDEDRKIHTNQFFLRRTSTRYSVFAHYHLPTRDDIKLAYYIPRPPQPPSSPVRYTPPPPPPPPQCCTCFVCQSYDSTIDHYDDPFLSSTNVYQPVFNTVDDLMTFAIQP